MGYTEDAESAPSALWIVSEAGGEGTTGFVFFSRLKLDRIEVVTSSSDEFLLGLSFCENNQKNKQYSKHPRIRTYLFKSDKISPCIFGYLLAI